MRERIWGAIARLVARPAVRRRLIERGYRTPYSPIIKDDETYMLRFWLFNPYDKVQKSSWRRWFPSVRLHKICLPDRDRHPHSHPWRARTIILDGSYCEDRGGVSYLRQPGDTATLTFHDYHKITDISEGGVWTLFITWKYEGTWGFLVDGKKVPYKTYLDL